MKSVLNSAATLWCYYWLCCMGESQRTDAHILKLQEASQLFPQMEIGEMKRANKLKQEKGE